MIRRLLVANRGEIARRVFATCRAMGISTVAVYSDADADAPYVAEADLAVRLPGNTPAETYLRGELIIEAARRTGADAVHPGYGFLAENAGFAAAVVDAGLTWVGPPAKAIAAMGSKIEAKVLLTGAGVPMLPTYTDADQVSDFPVLVKASAGGGGRGMRIVREPGELAGAIESARREAAAAFGDGTVFIERYLDRARHVEVQIFGDSHGNVVALGERECSIQRRHQKIVEETPSVAVGPRLREALLAAATAAGRAVGYVGAGTVEFLLTDSGGVDTGQAADGAGTDRTGSGGADSGEFFFLEMNTRLQVEHPVTECVTGLDLVRWQLLVAEGAPLPLLETPPPQGHAIEVRLCAEDPAADWRPATGVLHHCQIPGVGAEFGLLDRAGLRLDSGVTDGTAVGIHYDSMLAKLIAWAPTRAEAARLLAGALVRARLHGVSTNRDLLVRVLRHPAFAAGATDTGFLDRHPEVFTPLLDPASATGRVVPLAAALAGTAARRAEAAVLSAVPSGWRNVPSSAQLVHYRGPDGPIEVGYRLDRTGALATWWVRPTTVEAPGGPPAGSAGSGPAVGSQPPASGNGPAAESQPPASGSGPPAAESQLDVVLVSAAPDRVVLEVGGVRADLAVHRVGDVTFVDSPDGATVLTELPRFPEPTAALAEGSLTAALPGTVSRVLVSPGERVHSGQLLLILEAMKLEHPVHAPVDGTVTDLPVGPGTQVETGAVLAVVTADGTATPTSSS